MSWKQSTIGEVLSVIKNGINCEQNKVPVGDKITRIETIAKQYFDFNRVGYASLNEAEKEKSRVKKGDILFSHINSPIHVGKTAIYESDEVLFHGINLLLFRTIDDVNPHFFNLFLNYLFVTGYWEENCKKSVNQASVNQKDISKVKFSYPSLSLQNKIVSKIDAIYAEIGKALVASEVNAKNAESLFQSYLREIFTDNTCEMVKLSLLTDDISDGDHQPPPKAPSGVPFITISNVNKITREINFTDTFKVSREYYDNLKPNKKPIIGDVLYTVTGSFGIPIHIRTDDVFCFQRHIGLIRPSDKVDSRWLYWVMSSPQVFQQAIDSATGAAQLTVSLKALRNFVIPYMSLDKQRMVVKRIEELYKKTRLLADNYQEKCDSLRILKSSILQKAFNGELVKE